MAEPVEHAAHFESAERQGQAATLGMWVFLASEVLFFGALFVIYAAYRTREPRAFAEAVAENTFWWGSGNTLVLLTSSLFIALSVHMLRRSRARAACWLVGATVFLGMLFLGIKSYEYVEHFRHGIYPGGQGQWFADQPRAAAMVAFWTLYYLMTGLHALHVIIGVLLLSVIGWCVARRRVTRLAPQALENGAMYWHLVDIVWLFLWPCFYLTNGGA